MGCGLALVQNVTEKLESLTLVAKAFVESRAFTAAPKEFASELIFRPDGAWLFTLSPTAYAVACILAPLRGDDSPFCLCR
jgi:hypothetical protein